MYFWINIRFIDFVHNYKAGVICLTTPSILNMSNYYRSMKLMSIKSRLPYSSPGTRPSLNLCRSLVGRLFTILLVYQILGQKDKRQITNKSRNNDQLGTVQSRKWVAGVVIFTQPICIDSVFCLSIVVLIIMICINLKAFDICNSYRRFLCMFLLGKIVSVVERTLQVLEWSHIFILTMLLFISSEGPWKREYFSTYG